MRSTCRSSRVTWEQVEVGQPMLVVPEALEEKKMRKDYFCRPQESSCEKTISLISAGLINTQPNI